MGSTSGILKYAAESKKRGIYNMHRDRNMYELKKNNPDKKFYSPAKEMVCSNMKKISLEKIIRVLEANEPQVHLDLEFIENANKTLKNMLELGK